MKTKEELTIKLNELRKSAENKILEYNEKVQEGKFPDALALESSMDDDINEYTAIVQEMCFEECRISENPMLTAVKTLSFVTIARKDEKNDEDKIVIRSIVEKEKSIDLLKLNKFCAKRSPNHKGIGADPNWVYMAEKMNCLMTAQKAVDLGLDPKEVDDSFAMSKISKEINMGNNPVSKTNILKTLRALVSAMLGEEFAKKAVSHDVNFLLSVYSRKSKKALTVKTANNRYFVGYMAEICHRIATDKKYEIDFKKAKN